MRILLVNPPFSDKNLIKHYAPEVMKKSMEKIVLVGPPHGLCALAGNLRDFEVDIFDLKAEYRLGLTASIKEAVFKKLSDFNPDIVGVTMLTSEYPKGIKILETVKAYRPTILTVAGGIHPTLCKDHFNLPCVDIVLLGHGKKIFRDIVLAFRDKKDFNSIPNIGFRRNGKNEYTHKTNLFNTPDNLLSKVYADRDLIKKYSHAYRTGPYKQTLGFIESSLGCESKCTFCSIWPGNSGSYFKRAKSDIIAELKTMTDYQLIRFVDANTTSDIEHINQMFDSIQRSNLDNHYMIDMRADTAVNNPEVLKKAADAGLIVAIVGIESINDKELKQYNKETTSDINFKAIEEFQKYNINMRASIMIRPDYDEKDFKKIEEFISQSGLTHAAFSIMTPIPGTVMYKKYKDNILIKDLEYYNLLNSVIETKLPAKDFYGHIAHLHSKQVRVS